MINYRISKYDPKLRDRAGRYMPEDWIAISDIGKAFNGEILTNERYTSVEDSYVNAVLMIMDYTQIPYLTVNNIRKNFNDNVFEHTANRFSKHYSSKDIKDVYYNLKNGKKYTAQQIESIIRLLLREDVGMEVFYENELKVFIGYDFLMGVHTLKSIESIIPSIENMGLFVEVK
ncbi:hypothetical protein [Paenibacillus sp. FSL H8-0537]|uniref:hypothetical protein n=1 Tax=Paenibacillus sp. FSL H8-0537 TaxID=2921399 RepID=UPI0031015D06